MTILPPELHARTVGGSFSSKSFLVFVGVPCGCSLQRLRELIWNYPLNFSSRAIRFHARLRAAISENRTCFVRTAEEEERMSIFRPGPTMICRKCKCVFPSGSRMPQCHASIPDRMGRCGDGLGNPCSRACVYFFFAVLFPPASAPDLKPDRKEVEQDPRRCCACGAQNPRGTPRCHCRSPASRHPKRRHGWFCLVRLPFYLEVLVIALMIAARSGLMGQRSARPNAVQGTGNADRSRHSSRCGCGPCWNCGWRRCRRFVRPAAAMPIIL